jgi:hypothetical protein
MFSISGIVHFRSNAFDSTILKICGGQLSPLNEHLFTHLLHVDAVTCAAEDQTGLHRSCESLGLCRISMRVEGIVEHHLT